MGLDWGGNGVGLEWERGWTRENGVGLGRMGSDWWETGSDCGERGSDCGERGSDWTGTGVGLAGRTGGVGLEYKRRG